MTSNQPPQASVPRWLGLVLRCDRAGSSWYIGTGFFFAPVLAVLSPWPALTMVSWAVIAVTGLWLGLLGIAMATGLSIVLRKNGEISEDYWRSLLDYRTVPKTVESHPVSSRQRSQPASV